MLGVPVFSKGPVTAIVLLTYLVVFWLVSWTDDLPAVPKDQGGLNLSAAYNDLHHIAARPHPYNSHANDHVRAYILDRVHSIAAEFPHLKVFDDLRSNGSWASRGYGVYFEGTNILVKIEGTEPQYQDRGGVLFSAHYDSVSTAPGATDDGMGVVTLLQLIEYFAKNRMKRTAVFNINNGEEDWLNGAHAFLQHPWSEIPDTFLNLEGAAAGGRPILFRATSSAVLRAFRSKHVPHPHANVLSADAFKRGTIRSGTDYSVYTDGAHMQGLDLAFYKGRSKYHTKYDAVPYTDGQEKSLWSMMEAAKGAGSALLNDSKTHDPDRHFPAVYFDLFASTLVLFSLESLYIFNILFLVLSPIILAGLLFVEAVINARRAHHEDHHHHRSLLVRIFTDFRLMWRWAKFWVAILVTVAVQAFLIFIFVKSNPYIIYSYPYVVLFSLTVITYIIFTWIITFDLPFSNSGNETDYPAESEKETVLLQSYSLSWVLVLLSTIAIGKAEVGGLYPVTFWSAGVWIACGLASLETIFGVRGTVDDRSRSASRERPDIGPSERTPLMGHHSDDHRDATYTTHRSNGEHDDRRKSEDEEDDGAKGWWLLQFLLVVPAPIIMVTHIGNLLLDATSQTLADGNSKVAVYATASLIGFLLVLPLAPFSFKLHKGVSWLLLLLFVFVTLWATLWEFPFDSETPLKVYFEQSVQLEGSVAISPSPLFNVTSASVAKFADASDNAIVTRNVVTTLTGVQDHLRDDIIPKLPSASGKPINCSKSDSKLGLQSCSWRSGVDMYPQPGSAPRTKPNPPGGKIDSPRTANPPQRSFFRAEVIRTSLTSAEIAIQGKNTRNCRLYFDNRPVIKYSVQGGLRGMQQYYDVSESGIQELRLWSRTWDKLFVVKVEWRDYMGLGEKLKGRMACEWAEYASASAGVPGQGENRDKGGFQSAKIPALEEALSFLPTWVAVTKSMDGLVEGWESFEV